MFYHLGTHQVGGRGEEDQGAVVAADGDVGVGLVRAEAADVSLHGEALPAPRVVCISPDSQNLVRRKKFGRKKAGTEFRPVRGSRRKKGKRGEKGEKGK